MTLLEEAAPLWTFPARLMRLDPVAADLVRDPGVARLIREATPGG